MTEFPCKRTEVVLSLLISTSRSLLVQFWPGMPSPFSSQPSGPRLYSPQRGPWNPWTASTSCLAPTLDLVTGSLCEGRQ